MWRAAGDSLLNPLLDGDLGAVHTLEVIFEIPQTQALELLRKAVFAPLLRLPACTVKQSATADEGACNQTAPHLTGAFLLLGSGELSIALGLIDPLQRLRWSLTHNESQLWW